jgi:hypothetical protein
MTTATETRPFPEVLAGLLRRKGIDPDTLADDVLCYEGRLTIRRLLDGHRIPAVEYRRFREVCRVGYHLSKRTTERLWERYWRWSIGVE